VGLCGLVAFLECANFLTTVEAEEDFAAVTL